MNKKLLVGAIALLGMSSVFADSYIKAELQKSYNDSASDICDAGFESCTDTPTGFRFAYGYSFNDYIALEFGYGETGEFKAADTGDSLSMEISNFDVAAIGRIPMGDFFAFTGKLGLSRATSSFDYYDGYWQETYSEKDNSNVLVYGVGMELGWFTLGYEMLSDAEVIGEEDDFERLYAGVKFSF